MAQGKHFYPETLLALALCGVLLVGCTRTAAWAQGAVPLSNPIESAGSITKAGEASGGLVLPSIDALKQTRDRPLFSPSRRPPLAAAPPPPPPAPVAVAKAPPLAPPADQLVLTGIVLGQDTRVAVLRNDLTHEIHRVRRGERVDGWSVEEIELRSVVLSKDGRPMKLELFPDKKP